jgi:hypothetical protein
VIVRVRLPKEFTNFRINFEGSGTVIVTREKSRFHFARQPLRPRAKQIDLVCEAP